MECPHIPNIKYGEFSKRLHDKVADQRIPITGTIEVTARCNLHCAHCYINLSAGDQDALKRELSRQELCGIIDQIVDQGCLWLLFTGGEPLIRPDFLDIYTYARNKGLLITLFTNGTTITPRIADQLAEWRPFVVEITLYGRTQETYERVAGIPGSYGHCMRGIELLLEHKIPLKLKSMVLTLNKHELWDMKDFAEGLGLDFRYDPVINIRLDGSQKPAEFRISPQEIVNMDMADEKRVKEWSELCEKSRGLQINPEYLYQCSAGISTFHVDPYGQLSVCEMARVPSYNLRQGTFHKGWCDFMPRVLVQKWTQQVPCQQCELISLCAQCPGFAQLENGNQEAPVEYVCQIAHLRAEALGLKVNSPDSCGSRI
ncbi:radical SAM protein [candidate division KSB1 bacterium]|nr:radical SAM protein [candidate division KSB1 bacterium]